jgi:hypothetical protein
MRVVQPVLLSIIEHPSCRRFASGGREGNKSLWLAVYGITLGDGLRTVRGQGWYEGVGRWRRQRGPHPVPFGLEVWLPVFSSALSRHHPMVRDWRGIGLAQEEHDPEAVVEHVRRVLGSIGSVPVDELIGALSRHFVVDELD